MRILALPAAALLSLCLYLPLPRASDALTRACARLAAFWRGHIPDARGALLAQALLPAALAALAGWLHPAAAALTMAPLLSMAAAFPACAKAKDALDSGAYARDIPAYEARVREACVSLAPAYARGGVLPLLLCALGTALHVGGALCWAFRMLWDAGELPAPARRALDLVCRAADAVALALLTLCGGAVGRGLLRARGQDMSTRLMRTLGIAGDGTDTHAPMSGDIAQGVFLCCLCAALLLLLLTLALLPFA